MRDRAASQAFSAQQTRRVEPQETRDYRQQQQPQQHQQRTLSQYLPEPQNYQREGQYMREPVQQPLPPMQQQPKLTGNDLYDQDKKTMFFSLLTLLELGVDDARENLENQYRDPKTMVQMILENPDIAKYIIMNYLAFVVDKDITRITDELHRMSDTQFSQYCSDHGLINDDFFNMNVDVLLPRFNVNRISSPIRGRQNGLYNNRR